MKNSFSVIIPAYNCEKTIVKCINSILSQDYDNYEIIVVNDGSKDNTIKVLNDNYSNDKRIKIISKNNSGVSDARNVGIENSSKDWLLFLDSDDWVEQNSLNELNNLINIHKPDYIITRLIYSGKKDNTIEESIIDNKLNIIDNIVCLEYSDSKYNEKYKDCRCIGGKLVRKEIVSKNKIVFPSGIKKFEDGIFNLDVVLASNKILYSSYQFYNYYYDNPNSRMNTFNEDDVNESKKIFEILINCLSKNNIITDSLNYLAFYMFILSVDNIMHLDYDKKNKKDKIKKLKDYYSDYFKNIDKKYLSSKKRLELFASTRKSISLLYFLYVMKIKLLNK